MIVDPIEPIAPLSDFSPGFAGTPTGSPEQPFSQKPHAEFYQKLLEGFAMEALRQMQRQEEALKKAMKKGRH